MRTSHGAAEPPLVGLKTTWAQSSGTLCCNLMIAEALMIEAQPPGSLDVQGPAAAPRARLLSLSHRCCPPRSAPAQPELDKGERVSLVYHHHPHIDAIQLVLLLTAGRPAASTHRADTAGKKHGAVSSSPISRMCLRSGSKVSKYNSSLETVVIQPHSLASPSPGWCSWFGSDRRKLPVQRQGTGLQEVLPTTHTIVSVVNIGPLRPQRLEGQIGFAAAAAPSGNHPRNEAIAGRAAVYGC
jgi:hypothetical protein